MPEGYAHARAKLALTVRTVKESKMVIRLKIQGPDAHIGTPGTPDEVYAAAQERTMLEITHCWTAAWCLKIVSIGRLASTPLPRPTQNVALRGGAGVDNP